MACGPSAQGRAWRNVRLIAEEAVKRQLAPWLGRKTIRIVLQNHQDGSSGTIRSTNVRLRFAKRNFELESCPLLSSADDG